MARQVVFRPEAEDEVLEAFEWYENRRAGLGNEFAQAVDEIITRIIENPLAYHLAHQSPFGAGYDRSNARRSRPTPHPRLRQHHPARDR